MPTFTHEQATLWYEVLGEGDLVIALHGGLGLDHTYLRPWLDPLADGQRLAYLDLRANGRTTGSTGPGTMQSLADDVEALREHLGADSCWVLGHSYGGFVALQYALSYPGGLAGLVLCDTDSRGPQPATMARGLQRLGGDDDAMSAFGMRLDTPEDVVRFFDRTGPFYFPHSPPGTGGTVMAELLFRPEGSQLGGRALDGWDVTTRLGEITAPALVVVGSDDFMFPPEGARALAGALPAGRVVVIEEAGHLPFVEQREVFLAAVRAALG